MTLHRRASRERGAILVLTSIALITLMAFTAFAVDLGQRNQHLAGAQHAIDASVLTAAEYLSRFPRDYAGAAKLVKEVIRQNLGIDPTTWTTCDDADHLTMMAPNDTNCISFRPIVAADTGKEKYDIRVKLPNHTMRTVFGPVLGIDTIDLAATAASNGANCPIGATCGASTTVGAASTTTTPAKSTEETSCRQNSTLNLTIKDELWAKCRKWFPLDDRVAWQTEFCSPGTVVLPRVGGATEYWAISPLAVYIWHWATVCSKYLTADDRTAWYAATCSSDNLAFIYSDQTLYSKCKQLRPGLQPMADYLATTTTTSAPSTTSPSSTAPTTTAAPGRSTTTVGTPAGSPPSTPTSVELSG